MKICLVLPPYLPVPAVKGGAVETLVEDILKLNEKYKELQIDCITIRDKKAVRLNNKYPNTKFLLLNFCTNRYIDFLIKAINFVIRKLTKINIRQKIRDNMYLKLLSKYSYDFVIFEGVNPNMTRKITDKIGKEKLILHIHKDTEPSKEFEEMYGNFIGISKFVSERFCKNNIIDRNRVYTLYNGINFDKFDKVASKKEKEELKMKYEIKIDDRILIYTGRLLPAKGVKELILAFKMMKNKDKCKLLIVGSAVSGSSSETAYTKEIKRIAKDENVIFTGYISNDILYKYYQISDIAVFPSLVEEGFGLVAAEAMHSKLPVIITNSGGMKELVTDSSAIKVENDENLILNLSVEMDKLVENRLFREKMGNEAFELSKKYSDENYYKGYVKILNKIKNGENSNE